MNKRPYHGLTKTSEYRSWKAMKERCLNPNNRMAKHYSEKGITICERWIKSFVNFYEDMGEKPDPERFETYRLIRHAQQIYPNFKWDFESVREFLLIHDIEGIVVHTATDDRMCKIRKSDFGIKRLLTN